jgi:hypothetical protein
LVNSIYLSIGWLVMLTLRCTEAIVGPLTYLPMRSFIDPSIPSLLTRAQLRPQSENNNLTTPKPNEVKDRKTLEEALLISWFELDSEILFLLSN